MKSSSTSSSRFVPALACVVALAFCPVACATTAPPFTPVDGSDGGSTDDASSDGGVDRDTSVDAIPVDAGDSAMRFTACDKVDLLFVIDNSGSMADNQRSLLASFDGFMRGVRSRLSTVSSYHVGVVTSDDPLANPAGCQGIGSLVTRTAGPNSSNMACTPFVGGANFLTQAEPDLAARFRCIGQVGTSGSDDERMARALLNAVDPRRNAPGACNAGFARRDSLLVAVLITDEDDVADACPTPPCGSQGSGGLPDDWARELTAHRFGLAQNVVVLSLIGRRPDNPCGAVVNSRILGLTNRFRPNNFVGDICASSYDAFFDATLSVIETACRNFAPPG